MQLNITRNWEHHWNPRSYLTQYYQTPTVPQDEKAVYQFIHSRFSRLSQPFSSALDIGVGPTIHHQIALVPYVTRLDLADFLPQNLAEIRKWLDGDQDAYNWDAFIRGTLAIEGNRSPSLRAVQARKRLVRRRVHHLLPCNIKHTSPLGSNQTTAYPLVTAFFVADSVASRKSDWYRYMANIATLVEPGGSLLIAALRNTHYYRVGRALFPSAMVNQHDVERFYLSQGFEALDIQVAYVPELRDEGFESIILALGEKRAA
jgi:hypothetical protein